VSTSNTNSNSKERLTPRGVEALSYREVVEEVPQKLSPRDKENSSASQKPSKRVILMEEEDQPVRAKTDEDVRDTRKDISCHYCGERGHIKKFCSQNVDRKGGNKKKKSLDKHVKNETANYKDLYQKLVQEQTPKVSIEPPKIPSVTMDPVQNMKEMHQGKWVKFLYLSKTPKMFGLFEAVDEETDYLPEAIFDVCYRAKGEIKTPVTYQTYTHMVMHTKIVAAYLLWLYKYDIDRHSAVKQAIQRAFFINFEEEMENLNELVTANAVPLFLQSTLKPLYKGTHPGLINRKTIKFIYMTIAFFMASLLALSVLLPLSFFTIVLLAGYPSVIASYLIVYKHVLKMSHEKAPCTLLWFAPEFSVYLEEYLKIIPGMAYVIGVIEFLLYRTWTNYNWHVRSMKWNVDERIRKHKAHNSRFFLRLRDTYNATVNLPDVPVFNSGVEVIPSTKMLPASLPKPETDVREQYATMYDPVNRIDFKQYAPMHAVLWPVSSMRKPAPSYENVCAMLDKRIVGVSNSTVQWWAVDMTNSVPLQQISSELEIDKTKWRQGLTPVQLVRNQNYIKDRDQGMPEKRLITNQMILKSNELLPAREKFIPRPIHSVTGKALDEQGPFINEAMKDFASMYNHECKYPISFSMNGDDDPNKYTVYLYYTCGSRSRTLDIFYNEALEANDGLYIMCMGDDILAVNNYNKMRNKKHYLKSMFAGKSIHDVARFIESDFSKFDRTQTYMLQGVYWKYLGDCGYSKYAKLSEQMMKAPLECKHRGTNSSLLDPEVRKIIEMKLSGEPATGFSNSIINGKGTIAAIVSGDMEEFYTALGLKAKIKKDDDPRKTFLRGIFLDTGCMWTWVRLPSFLLKFGKTMTDPLQIYKGSSQEVYKKFVLSQWKGYGDMRKNWFYVALDDVITKLCSEVKNVTPEKLEHWQVVSDCDSGAEYVPDDEWNKFVQDRYGITELQQQSFISMLASVTELPCVYHHSLIPLLEKDY